MRKLLIAFILFGVVVDAGAQGHNPHAADPAHPATQVATTVAQALLTGEVESAAAAIAAVAATEYQTGALEAETRSMVEVLNPHGTYRLEAVMLGPTNGMAIVFRGTADPTLTAAAVVEMKPDAPYQVTGIRRARLQVGSRQ